VYATQKLIHALATLVVAAAACGGTPENNEPATEVPARFLRQDIDCSIARLYRGKWGQAAIFNLTPGGGSSLDGPRFHWVGEMTRSADTSHIKVTILDDARSDSEVVTHRYVIKDDEPVTNSLEPFGFTGQIEVLLNKSHGLRYFCEVW
jgi:hypothetical protein